MRFKRRLRKQYLTADGFILTENRQYISIISINVLFSSSGSMLLSRVENKNKKKNFFMSNSLTLVKTALTAIKKEISE